MVAIKDMEMPKNCVECNHMDLQQAINCQLIYSGCANCGRHPNCPLIEIEERKHGKWEHDKLFGECAYVCSFCHTIWTSSEIQNMHYCPTCGAEMVGAENG